MNTIRNLFKRKRSIYSTRIFETRSWLNQAVVEALRIQELDINLTTNPNIKEQ
jgi:hypothetical protein